MFKMKKGRLTRPTKEDYLSKKGISKSLEMTFYYYTKLNYVLNICMKDKMIPTTVQCFRQKSSISKL